MAISIQHNLSALNINRQFEMIMKSSAKCSEKLSSGYRINRAADDASGLSLSEKMRRQIRGLQQASRNIQDGISLCQVADGALFETHAILHRMNELSIQAANDTNQAEDRAAIQNEIDALFGEIDRIANTTTFNEKIYPLRGSSVKSVTLSSALSGNLTIEEYVQKSTFHYHSSRPNVDITADGVTYKPGEVFYVTGLRLKDSDTMWTEDQLMGILDQNGNPLDASHGNIYKTAYNSLRLSDLKTDANGYIYYHLRPDSSSLDPKETWHIQSPPANWDGRLYLIVNTSPSGKKEIGLQPYPSHSYSTGSLYTQPGAAGHYSDSGYTYEYLKGSLSSVSSAESGSKLWIQMGADPGNGMFLFLVDATANGLGLSKGALNVSDRDNAGNAIDHIKNAIEVVSCYRSQFGAQQNRLEHGMAIDENTAENTQAAEARIRDLNLASEMILYSKNNILAQMGQAILAQTNRRTQDILALLQ